MKTIFKSCKDTHFVKIANSMLRDKRLSMGARGLLSMILTHSEEWVVTKSWLINQGPDGYDAITSMLKELSSLGYAVNEKQGRDDSGTFTKSVWVFSDDGFTARGNPCAVNRVRSTVSRQPHTKKEQYSEENGTEENGEDIVGEGSPTPQLPSFPSLPQELSGSTLKANPEAEPTGSGRETPPVPRPPLTKNTPIRTKDTPRTRNPLLDALALCGGGSLEHMTPTEWGRAAKALKDIRSVKPDLTVEDIQIASDNYTKLYGSSYLTSTALSNNWSKVRPGVVVAQRTQSSAAKPPTRWGIEKEIEQITLTLSNHPGWIDSTKCDLTTRTQQQKDDADALIQKRKALRAQLLSFPSDL